MEKQSLSEVKQLQKIAGILKEETIPTPIEQTSAEQPSGFEKTIPINDVHSDYFEYDLDQLQDFANEYGFGEYDGGIIGYDGYESVDTGRDYQWAIERGDDFPHAVVIKNKQMLKNPAIVSLLKRLKGKQDLSA